MAEEHTAECLSLKDALSWEYEYKCDCGAEDRQEITILRAQLKEHGGHTADCAIWHRQGGDFGRYQGRDEECDCGWAEIEKELG